MSGVAKGVGGGTYVTYLCGGDLRPGPRDSDCPNALHNFPLPSGYVDAAEVAAHRLYKKWANVRCGDCGLYGWAPSAHTCVECAWDTK